MELRPLGRTDKTLPEAHRGPSVQVPILRPHVCTIRSPHVALEETHQRERVTRSIDRLTPLHLIPSSQSRNASIYFYTTQHTCSSNLPRAATHTWTHTHRDTRLLVLCVEKACHHCHRPYLLHRLLTQHSPETSRYRDLLLFPPIFKDIVFYNPFSFFISMNFVSVQFILKLTDEFLSSLYLSSLKSFQARPSTVCRL